MQPLSDVSLQDIAQKSKATGYMIVIAASGKVIHNRDIMFNNIELGLERSLAL